MLNINKSWLAKNIVSSSPKAWSDGSSNSIDVAVKDLITPTVDQILSFEILNGEFGTNKTINPYFDFQSKRIWGATAMILKELIDLLVK